METQKSHNTLNTRPLSRLINNSAFKPLITNNMAGAYVNRMKKLLSWETMEGKRPETVKDLIQHAYQHLLSGYRYEYLYKSSLLNDFILKNYSLDDTILLNEFRIGKSKADAVLVNGTNKVFEIKTELDSPERLNSQIADYYKAFSEVYLITHCSEVEKYKQILQPEVGILSFSNEGKIDLYRSSIINESMLDCAAMLKSLRKHEYLEMTRLTCGHIPDVSPVMLFTACLKLLRLCEPKVVQKRYLEVIKKRINKSTNKMILSGDLPDYIKFSCYHHNLDSSSYITLIKRLNSKL
ncbi:sce7726 family protein [Dyadobacter linearis]|nr:sce7726 family protein [Dyadobacter sp. CECT 9623]